MANVNGEIILLSDLRKQVALFKSLRNKGAKNLPAGKITERRILNNMIDEKVMGYYAREKDVKVSDADIDKAIENVKANNNLSDKALEQALKTQGTTLKKFRNTLRNQILIRRIVNMELTGTSISEEEARDYYSRHMGEFKTEERVRASHIILLVTENSGQRAISEAKAKIESIMGEIRAGADFAETAAKYSQDASAKTGGDLGWFTRGKMLPAFEKTAFALGIGEVGGPIRTRYGFHIVKVTDREESKIKPFEEVSKQIYARLSNELYNRKRMEWLKRLRNQAYIEVMY